MATSTTFKGQAKPMGKSGHFHEPRRHALQAQGFKTGHLSDSAIYEQYGIQNLERPARKVPTTSLGLENIEAETMQEKESQPKKVTFGEKIQSLERNFAESFKRERELKAKLRQEKLYKELDKKMPEPEEKEEPEEESEEDMEEEEDIDSDSAPAKFAHFIANLSDDYDSQDLAGLSEKELELLAVRFRSQNQDGLFGEPENPFLTELKKRYEARAELRREKAHIRAELNKPKQKEKGLLQDLLFD